MVVAWELRDNEGGLITTFFEEKKAVRAKEKLEAAGRVVKLEKVFDHHLKDRDPVVKKAPKKKKSDRTVPDLIPEGAHHVMVFLRPGDLITSELGIGVNYKGKVIDGVTRLIVSERGKVVPVITKGDPK
jgi:hypothetical protein